MKKKFNCKHLCILMALVLTMTGVLLASGVLAEPVANATAPVADTNPAIYVTQKTANSVVGVKTYMQDWNPNTRETSETPVSEGSGVCIQAGGYVLTNNHVIEGGSSYKVLLADVTEVKADLLCADSSNDLAVLKADTNALVPVDIGSSSSLLVGSTVIAIGNPGGEVLANTVTAGIVSALEREMDATNTTRNIKYIQHDAAINSGNSGGGLFNVNGELVGINTLKYAGSRYETVSFEGLGFAIPVDIAYPIAQDLIQYGKVLRPQMGVTVKDQVGPDDPMPNYAPAGACVWTVNENSPAERAGIKQYDFITHVNGVRVTSLRDLTSELDNYNAGDTVEITLVRYDDGAEMAGAPGSANESRYYSFGGNYYSRPYTSTSHSYETMRVNVTLEMPQE